MTVENSVLEPGLTDEGRAGEAALLTRQDAVETRAARWVAALEQAVYELFPRA